MRRAAPAIVGVALLGSTGKPSVVPMPSDPVVEGSTLSVLHEGRWVRWWSTKQSPASWPAPHPTVIAALQWRPIHNGVAWAELRLAGDGIGRRVRVIAVRLDPTLVRFRLEGARDANGDPDWSVDRSPDSALVSFNAGQFANGRPWGWLVRNGRELQRPGTGSLSVGVAMDSGGAVHWLAASALSNREQRSGMVEGFQSYPRLLAAGHVPEALRVAGSGVDLEHRDARLAFGQTADGTILIALTRFDGAGGLLDFVPFGLTTPEMAAVMGAIGARDAVMLDGGISSQLLIRDGTEVHHWQGLRKVPMGLVVTPRKGGPDAGTQ
jgi:hypothetical protein